MEELQSLLAHAEALVAHFKAELDKLQQTQQSPDTSGIQTSSDLF